MHKFEQLYHKKMSKISDNILNVLLNFLFITLKILLYLCFTVKAHQQMQCQHTSLDWPKLIDLMGITICGALMHLRL